MSYTFNKMPKIHELCKLIKKVIVKDTRDNGFTREEFANEIGLSEGTLENKLKPASPYDLTLHEFIHILDLTGNYEPLEYIAKRYGFTLCRPDTEPQESNDPITIVMLKALGLEEVQGDLAHTVKDAIQDGEIDEDEKRAIKDVAHKLRKLAAELQESLK